LLRRYASRGAKRTGVTHILFFVELDVIRQIVISVRAFLGVAISAVPALPRRPHKT
jgi:hypothetical protein